MPNLIPDLIIDSKAREAAIDPTRSFIVQAPAGSGKTELLTQRFLQLLSCTEKNPEEIIAITFTRKAAAEMRQRIIAALHDAAQNNPPEALHKQLTYRLAKKALERDQQLNWQLQKNPNRLRILTIDALSAYLVRQMPLSAQLSPQLSMIDDPLPYYREAAEKILLTIPMDSLLLHLDNRVYLLENLFVAILSQREQWLPHITGHQNNTTELRKHMEKALQQLTLDCLQMAKAHLNEEILSELIPLADFAGRYCQDNDPDNPIAQCHNIVELSESLDAFPTWLGIANLLLTQKGEWRKSVIKRQGFPAKCELKPQMKDFLASLATNDALKSRLHAIMLCPPLTYNDQQWEIIEALMTVLPLLAAQLNVIFARDSVSDFVELNLAALRALGDDEHPTDLALHLDYRINHLLIDEFQDTSVMQFQLIEKLIAGWSPNDGRSIFLVGDPMQSIYRFRNADVGLFIHAQQKGIGNIPLNSLTLQQNFRSSRAIVEWNNQNFQTIFPAETDITVGATPYVAAHTNSNDAGNIQWHPATADTVVNQIQQLQKNAPNDTIAILVRSRTHLNHIIQRLHQEKIRFQAVDLEPLAGLTEIQDIHSLTRALLHRADRIAWLALLRAPYCGLTLPDLTHIAEASQKKSVWTTLKNKASWHVLSDDGQQRLAHCVPALFNAIEQIGRLPFAQLLRRLYKQLHGFETLTQTNQMMNIKNYLTLIETLEIKKPLLSLNDINQELNTLYAQPNPNANNKLQIMTIHKAKGLEFDHVLLPELHRKAPYDKHQILKYLERPNRSGHSDLILAPIKAIDQKTDPVYAYLRRVDKTKSDYECARLLYVATTRAKKSLHLFANVLFDEETIKPPAKNSFLHLLWKNAEPHFLTMECNDQEPPASMTTQNPSISLRRFTSAYLDSQKPAITEFITQSQPINMAAGNSTPRHIGTIIHEALEHLAQTGTTNAAQWPHRLKQLNVPKPEFESALQTIEEAIHKTQKDPRGQWILSQQHEDAHCEFPLSFFENDQLQNIIIDRCFIDHGTRWIIDYKTGTATPNALQQYRQQLDTYAKAFQYFENPPIRIALYFPLSSEWHEHVNKNSRSKQQVVQY